MTWREEIIGNARLILGDCRDILPTLGRVDAVDNSDELATHLDGCDAGCAAAHEGV